jgi:hypothetical protein
MKRVIALLRGSLTNKRKIKLLDQNRQDWYTMTNLPFEYDFLTFRTIRPLLVLIRVL